MNRLALSCLLLTVSGQLGCAVGALGQASLYAESDAQGPDRGLDHPIAVGARWVPSLDVQLRGAGAPSVHFEVADLEILSAERGTLEGRKPGLTAVLVTTDDGTVLDFVHVWVKAPTSVDLSAREGQSTRRVRGRVDLFVDEMLDLEAAVSGEGQPLAGDLPLEWRVDGSAVALLDAGAPARRRLVAATPGTTRLIVSHDRSSKPECAGVEVAKAPRCGPGDVFTTLDITVRERPSQLAERGGAR
jgi:hypothetical protein